MYSNQLLKEQVSTLPLAPGCYIYKDISGKVLYVGKARLLKRRVRSYFDNSSNKEPKIIKLVSQINSLEYIVTDSEFEAIILETNLIKKYRPKYNTRMKDDKNYVWLMIDASQDFPVIKVVREKTIKKAIYLGPYPSTLPVRRILKKLRRIYPYRTCNRSIIELKDPADPTKLKVKSSDTKPCLYFYLGLCKAPCAGMTTSSEYKKNTFKIKRFFESDKFGLKEELTQEMQQAAKDMNFEEAAKLRDRIGDLDAIAQRVNVNPDTFEEEFIAEKKKRRASAVEQLLSKLDMYDIKSGPEFRMECYDISNIQGKNAVGSMVVFVDGKPKKTDYRKFKIKTKDTPDDFAMMKEVLTRRLKRSEDEDGSFSKLPDLLIVDGGKGQLSISYKILVDLGFNIPIVGLAKKKEEIFVPSEEEGELKFLKRTLKVGSEGRFLVQRIRDESHRFAISYHRKLRAKQQIKSSLDDIPGIGPVTKRKLIQAFGGLDGIKNASESDLNQIIKNKTTVKNLKKLTSQI